MSWVLNTTQDQELQIIINMTTPASGQISLGDLKSELNSAGFSAPSADIALSEMNSYNMLNGFYDTYGYSFIGGGAQVPLSNFYDLQAECASNFVVAGTVTEYDLFMLMITNDSSAGGINGANYPGNNYFNPNSGTISPGTTSGVNIVHFDQLSATVSCNNTKFPPTPPFANLAVRYNNGGGLTNFPGSPFNGPAINVNSGTVSNAANSSGTPTFTVQCG